ncbi:MAG: alpha/beta hydrolase [Rhodanobacteraceae bacterium]|nr:alpha/beta hydrolase [Rhodanobacteraceae bacterium]
MTPDTLHVRAPDGAGTELLVHSATSGDIIYWLPALGVTARHYARFAETLAATGIGLARHEWRGAGSSDQRARRGVDWRYRDLLVDVAAGIATLRAHHPEARIWIGGHSLGAQFAALVLARDPSLAGLIIVASGTPYWRSFPVVAAADPAGRVRLVPPARRCLRLFPRSSHRLRRQRGPLGHPRLDPQRSLGPVPPCLARRRSRRRDARK